MVQVPSSKVVTVPLCLPSEVEELRQRLQFMEADLRGRDKSLQEREEDLAATSLRERELQQQLQVSGCMLIV